MKLSPEMQKKAAFLEARHQANRAKERKTQAVDIGTMQRELELANANLKKTRKALEAAKKNFQEAQRLQSSLNLRFVEMAESISGAANTA